MDESILINDVASHQTLLLDHEDRLKRVEANVLDVKQSVKSLVEEVADIKISLGTLKNVSNELSYLKDVLESFRKSITETKEQFQREIDGSKSKIVSIESTQSNDKGYFENTWDEIRQTLIEQNRMCLNIHKNLDGKIGEVYINLSDIEKSIKSWSETKILELMPKDSTPLFQALRSEVFAKLEAISIDCMNAVLKAGNISNQIPMLEKRIENISLILKKYELNQ